MFTIAKTLVQISETECFKDDGFKNVADYGKQIFNYEKSTVYNFVNIGKMFTDSDKLTSNLTHTEHDFSMSQLARLIPLGSSEVANELIEQGKFNENSTIKEIEKAYKAFGKDIRHLSERICRGENISYGGIPDSLCKRHNACYQVFPLHSDTGTVQNTDPS